jgi:galactokinase/mevalonate kinase-like predicted kinase
MAVTEYTMVKNKSIVELYTQATQAMALALTLWHAGGAGLVTVCATPAAENQPPTGFCCA